MSKKDEDIAIEHYRSLVKEAPPESEPHYIVEGSMAAITHAVVSCAKILFTRLDDEIRMREEAEDAVWKAHDEICHSMASLWKPTWNSCPICRRVYIRRKEQRCLAAAGTVDET